MPLNKETELEIDLLIDLLIEIFRNVKHSDMYYIGCKERDKTAPPQKGDIQQDAN